MSRKTDLNSNSSHRGVVVIIEGRIVMIMRYLYQGSNSMVKDKGLGKVVVVP